MPRPKVFVSYSHKDRGTKALQQIQTFLAPLEREGILSLWADTRMQAGDDWKEEILRALSESTVAVLLITQGFLASEFIASEEIPRILEREAEGKLKILPVFVSPSSVNEVHYPDPRSGGQIVLSKFQGFGRPEATLASLKATEREQIYVELARRLRDLTAPAAAPARPVLARPPADPARLYELTVVLETRGDKIHLSYHLPGLEPIAAETVPCAAVEEKVKPILDALDRGNRQALQPHLEDPNGWGKALFDVLFVEDRLWEPVFRTLFHRPTGTRPNASAYPVRLRLQTDDPRLSGLPWRLTSWSRQPLVDAGWTFTTTSTTDPILDQLTPAPCHVLAVGSDPDHERAVLEALKNAWPTGRDPGYFEPAATRAELETALRLHRPHLLYVYGKGTVEAGRPSLVLDGVLSLADLRKMFLKLGHTPAVVYLDTEGLTTPTSATPDQIFLDTVPLLFWRRQSDRTADAPSVFLLWLRRWLERGEDPVAAFHTLQRDGGGAEVCTVAIHSNYRSWQTKVFEGAAVPRSRPGLQIDRDAPKALVQKHVEELVRSSDQRVIAIVPYALAGNSIDLFWEQIDDHLLSSLRHLAALRWVRLELPPSRANLRRDLEKDLPTLLHAEPNESLQEVFRRLKPKGAGRGCKPVLCLNWGTFGEEPGLAPSLTDEQLADWLLFASDFLGPRCPPDLRIVAYTAHEVPEARYKSFARKLRELRQEPWCFTSSFRLSDAVALEEVDMLHLLAFLADRNNSDCEAQIQREVAQRIIQKTGGAFTPTVALVEEAQATSWYALLERLRREVPR